MKISVVLAAKNEESNLRILVPSILNYYDKYVCEIIVVNDNSTDNTQAIVEELIKKYPKIKLINRGPPPGVGRALKDGFKSVSKDATHVLIMDSDFINNIPDIEKFLKKAEEGYDVVIGSRYMPGGRLENYPPFKRLANRAYHFLVRSILGIKHHDLTNNFKLFKLKVLKNIKFKSNNFAINAETGLFPCVKGYKTIEVPVVWIERSYGKSNFNVIKLGPSYLKVMLRILLKRI